MYNRQFVKGVMTMLIAGMAFVFAPTIFIILWMANLLDATLIAKRLHEGQMVTDFQTF